MSTQLQAWNIEYNESFQAEHLEPQPDLVIVGNACKPSNPEAQTALTSNIPCTSMPQAIHDFFLKTRQNIVVCGTHGKTTTTALIGHLLTHTQAQKPGLLVGGVCPNFNGSFQIPESDVFVIEGDEYDSALFDKVPKFTHYNPTYAVLTSIEFDHADIYDDIDQITNAFERLMPLVPTQGRLWVCQDYPLALEVAKACKAPVKTYSASTQANVFATEIEVREEGIQFKVHTQSGEWGKLNSPLFGRYNLANTLAAVGIALDFGLSLEQIQAGLSSFEGIRRRQEIIAQFGDLLLFDDFAHHPTAIRVTTQAIRERFPQRRIWGIFEPRSNTARRNFFQNDLPKSFDACDIVVFGWPYAYEKTPEDQRLDIEQVVSDLQGRGKRAAAFPHIEGRIQDLYDWNAAKAAAGIYSNVEDMSQWLKMLLNEGKVGEQQMLSEETLDYLFRQHTP
ncbi:MAG: Mur ligase family protein, partial [Myxococcota bacterium]